MALSMYERLNQRPEPHERKLCLLPNSRKYSSEVAIVEALAQHRFMTTPQLQAALWLAGFPMTTKQLYKIVRPLWENDVLSVPTFWTELRCFKELREKIYALGARSAQVLGDHGLDPGLTPKHVDQSNQDTRMPFGEHTIMRNQFSLSLRAALHATPELHLTSWDFEDLSGGTTGVGWGINRSGKGHEYRVFPDLIMRLSHGTSSALFLVEIDNSTERGTKMSDKFEGFSRLRALVAQFTSDRQQLVPRRVADFIEKWGLHTTPWYPLFVVRVKKRMDNLHKQLVSAVPGRGASKFLFLVESTYVNTVEKPAPVRLHRSQPGLPVAFGRCHRLLAPSLHAATHAHPMSFADVITPKIRITPASTHAHVSSPP